MMDEIIFMCKNQVITNNTVNYSTIGLLHAYFDGRSWRIVVFACLQCDLGSSWWMITYYCMQSGIAMM